MAKRGSTPDSSASQKRSKPTLQEPVAIDPPAFNSRYSDPEFAAAFNRAFREREPFEDPKSNAKVIEYPYPTASLPNFLQSSTYLKTLREELLAEDYFHKSNDLYEFYQSEDLRLSRKPHIAALKNAIYSQEFFAMMTSLTGIDLDPSVIDLNGNQYHEGCYLLCHDDDIKNEKEGRRIAFILYLVDEDWSAADGGALDLFKCNETGYPVEVMHSLVPVRNTLAFFELSSVSYHQVAEVLTRDKSRISISGWFHGPLQTKLVSKTMLFAPLTDQPDASPESLLNPDYLSTSSIQNICNVFSDQSSIELQQFLKPDIYKALLEELEVLGPVEGAQAEQPLWDEQMGPSHVRKYSRISHRNQSRIPTTLRRVQQLFASKVFEEYLTKISSLSFLSANTELRMFKKGDYTLLHDHALERNGLDVVFSFPFLPDLQQESNPAGEWDEKWGAGATHYVADKANLLTLYPKHNTLTMVLRDEGTLRFVRYLNARVGAARRRELSALYAVNDEEDDDGDDDDDDGEGEDEEEEIEQDGQE
ncbi:Oxoglutarate and iron-dependent oxygenase degradation C-term-domain-containing protein [Dissophora ornata]|nr:Prolyl 3-hydroxylase ogfod1 [Dissophora ornata]KAI8602550.1 Oxoglutarate and iron-dependent oxygenase degradation C-term-domain-containing protein [Dissophora ornata]